jgi:hypothetical protein
MQRAVGSQQDEVCLDLMTWEQRDVGHDPVVPEQELPRQTTCNEKNEIKMKKILLLLLLNCKAVNIEKVHSFLRKINSEQRYTSTIVAMRTKP